MKLMIDIPREDYELVRDKDEFSLTELADILNTIAKGTPLPEEHQRYKPIILQEQQPCEDCISRQVVKDMLTAEWTKYIPMELDMNLSFILDKISALPSVTPKAKTGHWINLGVMPSDLGDYRWCSNCNCGIDAMEFHRNHYNYCPNCGAKMEVEE